MIPPHLECLSAGKPSRIPIVGYGNSPTASGAHAFIEIGQERKVLMMQRDISPIYQNINFQSYASRGIPIRVADIVHTKNRA